MSSRIPDEGAAAGARDAPPRAADQDRFWGAVRGRERLEMRGLPGCILWLALAIVLTPGGCYAGALVSERMGTVGDLAGGLEALARMGLGGLLGLVATTVVFRQIRGKWSRSTERRG